MGIGFDHMAITPYGYEAITLYSASLKLLGCVHSTKDKVDLVTQSSLRSIGNVCEAYARDLDEGEKA